MSWCHQAGILLAGVLFVGCSSLSPEKQAARNRVLDEYRLAAVNLRAGNYEEAKRDLDSALVTLGGITAGDKTAREARNYFKEESRKNFRGEPYERVMAYYYRAILYWRDGEIDNARACYRSAAVQDFAPELGITKTDIVLLDYLDGLATTKLAGDGSDAFRRAESSAKLAHPPAYDAQANVLVFVELGNGPRKYATGEYNEQLRFSPGGGSSVAVNIRVEGQVIRASSYDDLTYQATTRGGRVMDYILANKAVFKGATDTFGNAALITGGILAASQHGQHNAGDEVGAGLLVAGLIGKLVSAATTPAADTRMWDNLPNLLGFAALRLPPGSHAAALDFLDPHNRVVASRPITIEVQADRDTVLFVSDHH
jgi:hypothetical protein